MENKPLKLQHGAIIKSVESSKEGVLTIKGIASMYRTPEGLPQVDRDNELVNLDFLDLDGYRKNPILVFQHDWAKPAGRVLDIVVKNGSLHITAEVHRLTGLEHVYEAVERGIIKSLSIGTVPHGYTYRDVGDREILEIASSTLVEISLTTVQSNQEALFEVIASKSPTISKQVLATQNGMTCDELDGSCAFKSELKHLEKENTMETISKEVNTAAEPVKESEVKEIIEPVKESEAQKESDMPTAPDTNKKLDEQAIVDAILEANRKAEELVKQKEEEAKQKAEEEKAQAEAEAKARVENAKAYIKSRYEEVVNTPDEEFDPDTVQDFYELVSTAAEVIENKVISIVQGSAAVKPVGE